MRYLCLAIWLGASSAALADQPADYMAGVEGCFEKARKTGGHACIGAASNLCQDSLEGGSSTLGVSECEAAEAAAWDAVLNREYEAALAWAREIDEGGASPAGNAVEIVKVAEGAWIVFRDAQCKMDYARWGNGSMRNIAAGVCSRSMTAMRALELYNWSQIEPEEQP